MDPRRRGDDDGVYNIYFFMHRHTGAVFYFYGPYSRLRGNDKFFILYLSSIVIPAQAGIHCFIYSFFVFTDWIAAAAPRDDRGV